MYSPAVAAPVLAFLVALVLASSMPSAMAAGPVTAKPFTFNAEAGNWERTGDDCANIVDDQDHTLLWRSRFPWAKYVADKGPYRGLAACFLCLEVTNAGNDNSVIVRIVDLSKTQAGDPPILMDVIAFNQIDTDGNGAAAGELQVNYEVLTPCPGD